MPNASTPFCLIVCKPKWNHPINTPLNFWIGVERLRRRVFHRQVALDEIVAGELQAAVDVAFRRVPDKVLIPSADSVERRSKS